MTGTSHAVTGALIGATIVNPIIALPLAFVSHFVLDAIPHSGFDAADRRQDQQKLFHISLYIDAFLLALFFIFLFANNASLIIFLSAIIAGSPDFVWAYRYVFQEKFGKYKPKLMNRFNTFHATIQKQSMKYLAIEIPFTLAALLLLSIQL